MADTLTPIALPVKEAAHYIGISDDTLAKSDCPRVRIGRRVVYRIADLDAFLVQRRTHGAAA